MIWCCSVHKCILRAKPNGWRVYLLNLWRRKFISKNHSINYIVYSCTHLCDKSTVNLGPKHTIKLVLVLCYVYLISHALRVEVHLPLLEHWVAKCHCCPETDLLRDEDAVVSLLCTSFWYPQEANFQVKSQEIAGVVTFCRGSLLFFAAVQIMYCVRF